MAKINDNFLKLPGSYLFSTIAKKVAAYTAANPDKEIIKMGIGDVTKPLAPAVIEAMHKAVDEMGTADGFRGYGPEQGYDFLRDKIVEKDYRARGIDIKSDEIFVSDGAKSDCGNIGDIFSKDNKRIKKAHSMLIFGGGCVNDCVVHLTNPNMPFGGVGNSGLGSYHSKQGFDTFTHEKSILRKSLLLDIPVRYAPYKSNLKDKIVRLLMH